MNVPKSQSANISSTRPSPGFKKATDNFNHMWYTIRNANQMPLKGALYNFVIVIVVASIVAVCLVLGPFLKPLLWSVLIGAVLFPFKYSLSFALKKWFERVDHEDGNLLVSVCLAPIEALDELGRYFTSVFVKHMQMLIGSGLALFLLSMFISYAPKGFFCAVWRNIRYGHMIFTNVLSSIDYTVVIAAILIYGTIIFFLWKPENSVYFMFLGQALWIIFIAYGCSFLGALQIPVFLATLIYASAGIILDFNYRIQQITTATTAADDADNPNGRTILQKLFGFFNEFHMSKGIDEKSLSIEELSTNENIENLVYDGITATTAATDITTPKSTLTMDLNIIKTTNHFGGENIDIKIKSQSEIYFKVLFFASIATILYNQTWILFFVLIPIVVYIANKLIITFCLKEWLINKWEEFTNPLNEWILTRQTAILPICLPGVMHLNRKINKQVQYMLYASIDTASSIIMILLLILIVIFAGIFCAIEIYSETITIVQLGNDVVNWTIHHQPELVNMLPAGVTNSFDDVIENAYQYGRTNIETYVDELLKNADTDQRKHFKNELLSVWDRMVQYWVNRDLDESFNGPKVPASAISESIGQIVNNEELLTAAQQGLIGWVKKNVDLLMEVLNSVWVIIQANLNIFTSILGTLMSVFLGGGQAFITFIINSVIFLTSLFYLLSSSEDKYYPLAAAKYLGLSSGPRIAEAIETAVSSVLFASTKLALFHGLFTWLTHTIFGARVIFIPAVMAGVLAAVPFLGTYWCSIPAFLDLWLIQDRFSLGITLLFIHFIFPTSFVDPAIYADVQGGGHAYLTGLSIAGGMFWLGWEGAIFGPMLLCLLVVIFDLTTNAIKESPATPRHPSFSD